MRRSESGRSIMQIPGHFADVPRSIQQRAFRCVCFFLLCCSMACDRPPQEPEPSAKVAAKSGAARQEPAPFPDPDSSQGTDSPPVLYRLPDFELTDQMGERCGAG